MSVPEPRERTGGREGRMGVCGSGEVEEGREEERKEDINVEIPSGRWERGYS